MANIKYAGEEAVRRIADYVNKKLPFVSSMPVSPETDEIVLYVGNTTASYIQGGLYKYVGIVTKYEDITESLAPDADPKALSLYEEDVTDPSGYKLTNDTTVVSEKHYYEKIDSQTWTQINSVQTIELTKDEYDALPIAVQNNGSIYFITDADSSSSSNISINTGNVIESVSAGTITKKSCTNGVVSIMGTSPAGSDTVLAKIKTAYKPKQTIGAVVYAPSSSDIGKAQVSVDQVTGNIILSTTSALNYGVHYSIMYSIS